MSTSPKVWLITGTSSGLGRSVAEYALAQGDRVVATLRKPEVLSSLGEKYPSTQLLVLKLDVTNHEDVKKTFSQAKEAFGRIDVVYNNAGISLLGEVEGTPEEAAKKVFEVDFWSAVNVSMEAVKFFRDVNKPSGGRVINASTVVAVYAMATFGFYGASRAAFNVVSEALAQELNPEWNIKITTLIIGPFKTKVHETGMIRTPIHPLYAEPPTMASFQVRKHLDSGSGNSNNPEKAAIQIFKLTRDENPPVKMPFSMEAVEMVKASGEALVKIAEKNVEWSKDLAFDRDDHSLDMDNWPEHFKSL